jgi:hypothetical protein
MLSDAGTASMRTNLLKVEVPPYWHTRDLTLQSIYLDKNCLPADG